MTWVELLESIQTKAGAPPDETRAVMEAFVDVVFEGLAAGDEITVPGLVKFARRWQAPRTVRAVHDRRKVRLDGRWVPRVKPSRRLRRALTELSPQPWRDPEHQRAWRVAETLVDDLDLYHPEDVPSVLPDDSTDAQVESACAQALGAAWTQASRAYASKVSERVRSEASHLTLAARRRWASAS